MVEPSPLASSSVLSDPIVPPDPRGDGELIPLLHDREYRVRAYLSAPDRVLIRGAVRDQKPPGLYFEEDPNPLTIHHMQLDIEVAYPSMEIVDARVHFETHPNPECPHIVDHYGGLVGLSIARGFTHRVRELFGGPRGCTHTTALLQAMAPVAVQCIWSMRALASQSTGGDEPTSTAEAPDRSEMWKMNVGSCHVWAEDGPAVTAIRSGEPMRPPDFAAERMVELGLKPEDWNARMA